MAHATSELVWLKHLLQELHFCEVGQMELVCDNQSAIHLSSNYVFHQRTKHIEVGCHFIREKNLFSVIKISCVNSKAQLDIFTKSLQSPWITYVCDKMNACMLHLEEMSVEILIFIIFIVIYYINCTMSYDKIAFLFRSVCFSFF